MKIFFPILFVLLFALILFIGLYRRIHFKRNAEDQSKEIYLRELSSVFHKDDMEVNRSQIQLYETLGEGAFGVVRKGKLDGKDVAVKMLKGNYKWYSVLH